MLWADDDVASGVLTRLEGCSTVVAFKAEADRSVARPATGDVERSAQRLSECPTHQKLTFSSSPLGSEGITKSWSYHHRGETLTGTNDDASWKGSQRAMLAPYFDEAEAGQIPGRSAQNV